MGHLGAAAAHLQILGRRLSVNSSNHSFPNLLFTRINIMKTPSPNRPNRRLHAGALALVLFGSLLWAGSASAAGTLSGTAITNTATLSYAVSGTAQGNILSSPDGLTPTGVATSFLVDNKINLTLTETSTSFTGVAPGALAQATGFLLTNTGNTAQGYSLSAANVAATVFGLADTFDVSNFKIYVDTNGDGILQAGEATAVTFIDTLAPDASIFLIVTADIPVAQANGTQAAISLTALTRTALTAGAGVVSQAAANTQGGIEIVFADAATLANGSGTDPGQFARDAQAFAYDAYRVQAALISVSKTVTPICDPFNGSTGPKNIPGSAVQYAITITNAAAAGASATLSQITDALNANLTFDPGLISGAGAGTACVAGTANQAPAVGFGAVRGTGTVVTTYVAPGPGNVSQAVTAGATFVSPNVTINFAALVGTAYGAANPVLAPNSFVTVYFNAFVK
jgi:hypothetical protein